MIPRNAKLAHPNALVAFFSRKDQKFENLAFLTGEHSCKRASVEMFKPQDRVL